MQGCEGAGAAGVQRVWCCRGMAVKIGLGCREGSSSGRGFLGVHLGGAAGAGGVRVEGFRGCGGVGLHEVHWDQGCKR